MARPRKAALTPEQRAERKDAKRKAAELNAARDWGAKMPADPQMRKDAFEVLRKAEAEVKQAQDWAKTEFDLDGCKRRLTEVHGWHKAVIVFDKQMAGLSEGMRARVWRQLQRRAADAAWDAQGEFDLEAAGKTTEDTGSVFDSTTAGEAQATERGDDPGRASR